MPERQRNARPLTRPPLLSLLWVFARYGNVTFGGGSATIAELERELINRRTWLTHDESRLAYALSRITPGTNLLAYCVGVGWLLRGLAGAVAALAAASLPCSILAVLVTALYGWWSRNAVVSLALHGALVAAVGVIAATAWTLVRPYTPSLHWFKILLGCGGALLLAVLGITPLHVLIVAAATGALWPQGAKQ